MAGGATAAAEAVVSHADAGRPLVAAAARDDTDAFVSCRLCRMLSTSQPGVGRCRWRWSLTRQLGRDGTAARVLGTQCRRGVSLLRALAAVMSSDTEPAALASFLPAPADVGPTRSSNKHCSCLPLTCFGATRHSETCQVPALHETFVRNNNDLNSG